MNQEKKHDGGPRYEDLFVRLSKQVEKWILRSLAFLLGLLLVSQMLMQIPGLRYHLVKIEQIEGIPYHRSS